MLYTALHRIHKQDNSNAPRQTPTQSRAFSDRRDMLEFQESLLRSAQNIAITLSNSRLEAC